MDYTRYLVSVVLLGAFLSVPSVYAKEETKWELDREEDGIEIECTIHKKSGYRYCRSIMEVDYTMEELLGINLDAAGLQDWMDSIKFSKQFERFSSTEYINCFQYSIPLPFYDRESCAKTNILVDEQTGEVNLKFKSVPNIYMKTIGHEGMKFITGNWLYERLENGKIRVTFNSYANLGGLLKPILYNPEAANVTFNSTQGMIKMLDSGKYVDARPDFLEYDFKSVREENGIELACRNHSNGTRYCRSTSSTMATIEELLSIISDTDQMSSWAYGVENAIKAKQHGNSFTQCIDYAFPEPVGQRKSCEQSRVTINESGDVVEVLFSNASGEPLSKDRRLAHVSGHWKFSKSQEGGTDVEYLSYYRAENDKETKTLNSLAPDASFETLNNVLRIVKSGKYKGSKTALLGHDDKQNDSAVN